MGDMTKNQMKDILDRVLTWPTERQEDVAHVVESMEEQDKSGLRLTDARRCAAGSPIPVEKRLQLSKSSNGFAHRAHEGNVRSWRER